MRSRSVSGKCAHSSAKAARASRAATQSRHPKPDTSSDGQRSALFALRHSIRFALDPALSLAATRFSYMVILVIITIGVPGMAPRGETGHDAWGVAEAKARLSEVIDRAQGEPQVITRNGKPSAIVVSVEEWARKTTRKGTLAEFLLNSPLRGAELDLERLRDEPRDLGF